MGDRRLGQRTPGLDRWGLTAFDPSHPDLADGQLGEAGSAGGSLRSTPATPIWQIGDRRGGFCWGLRYSILATLERNSRNALRDRFSFDAKT
jgi:hypothetical protein